MGEVPRVQTPSSRWFAGLATAHQVGDRGVGPVGVVDGHVVRAAHQREREGEREGEGGRESESV